MACLHGLLWKCFAICCPLVPSFICGYTWLTNCLCFGPRCLLWPFPFPLGHFQSPGQCASPPVVENIDRKAYCLNIWGQIIQAPWSSLILVTMKQKFIHTFSYRHENDPAKSGECEEGENREQKEGKNTEEHLYLSKQN